ncbi:MAG: phosphoadenosine phosphosulfate reductase family protein [Cyanobacteria bacterium J06632_19]
MQQLTLFNSVETVEPEKKKVSVKDIPGVLNNPPPVDLSLPKFVSYGGGKNSTAMLILMYANRIKPDAILFADTRGEKPETYQYLKIMNEWLKSIDFPEITIVRANNKDESLEDECLRSQTLPSKAYGRGQCSSKWKIRPQEKYRNQWKRENGFTKHIEFVGIHYGEQRRLINNEGYLKPLEDHKMRVEYPLIMQKIDEFACLQLIQAVGLPLPAKSACFFCPSMKPTEIIELKKTHPDLYERALEIERQGMKTARVVKGMGRRFSWANVGQLTPLEKALLDQQKANRQCGCID